MSVPAPDLEKLLFLQKLKKLSDYANTKETVSVFEITQSLGSSTAYIATFLLSLLILVVPTYFVYLEIPLLIYFGILVMKRQPIWMPDCMKRQYISKESLQRWYVRIERLLVSCKNFLTDRGSQTFRYPWLETFHGFLMILSAILIGLASIQYFPGSTVWPNIALIVLAMGEMMNDDSYSLLFSYLLIVLVILYSLSMLLAMLAMPKSLWFKT